MTRSEEPAREPPIGPVNRWPVRPTEHRIVAGVCSALANSLGADVTLVRLAALVLGLAWGIGILVYVALWITLPGAANESDSRSFRMRMSAMRADLRASSGRMSKRWKVAGDAPWPLPVSRRTAAAGAGLLGTFIFLASFGLFDWVTPTRAVGIVLVLLGLLVVNTIGPGHDGD